MKHLLIALGMIVLLCLLAIPLAAQEQETENPQPVQPTYLADGIYTVNETVIIGALFIVGALIGLIAAYGVLLYKSAPSWLRDMIKPLADLATQRVDALVKTTPNELDDELWLKIKARLQKEFAGQIVAG